MDILHIAAECYPAAKVGGLGDVVGALPKYLCQAGTNAAVIIPKYGIKWFHQKNFTTVYSGNVRLHQNYVPFEIQQCTNSNLGFDFFVADIPEKFARNGIYNDIDTQYGYADDPLRWLCFQQAVLKWVGAFEQQHQPKILHCHDHHTGLMPFLIKNTPEYKRLSHIKTIFTIHNGVYSGAYSWRNSVYMPLYYAQAQGLLDWADTINPLASAVRCADVVTTVSNSYLDELKHDSMGLEWLYQHAAHKSIGIVNGIDAEVWNPETDDLLTQKLENSDILDFKQKNKADICRIFNLDNGNNVPLVVFIGRLVTEKGAELLPEIMERVLGSGMQVNFAILGSGNAHIANQLHGLAWHHKGKIGIQIAYNEALAHQLYAAADFLLMPSKVEPCGLNQLYAMRYGTVPVVRKIGGLKDTVPDIGEPNNIGCGINFERYDSEDAFWAIYRATMLYKDPNAMAAIRQKIMTMDFSWEKTVKTYQYIYNKVME